MPTDLTPAELDAIRERAERPVPGIRFAPSELYAQLAAEARADRAALLDALRAAWEERDRAKRDGQMADDCLRMVHDVLATFHGAQSMKATAPMFYPEAIQSLVYKTFKATYEAARAEPEASEGAINKVVSRALTPPGEGATDG